MKRFLLLAGLSLGLYGCGDAYDDIADACRSSRALEKLSPELRQAYCACQVEEARGKEYAPEILAAFAEKWRGEAPKNVSALVQGEWFLFQLRCIRKTGAKL
ncbi:MAG: hypothetical protein OEO83_02070 [Alphaproteobacteria bacterium]|nr:hypothetical protein [Alphaproteobacteria bacterium]